jgi:hypothetical protein
VKLVVNYRMNANTWMWGCDGRGKFELQRVFDELVKGGVLGKVDNIDS